MSILEGIAVGEYGRVITITCVDANGTAVDLSTYTIAVNFKYSRSALQLSLSGAYLTDGKDGKLTCAFTTATTPSLAGAWHGQVVLSKANTRIKSEPFSVSVWESI